MIKKIIFVILFAVFFASSCLSAPVFNDNEPVNDQLYLISILEDIINSQDDFYVEALSRRTFSPRIKQTALLTHSFYLITLSDGRYYTLSFSNANLKLFKFNDNGIWVLNKITDISSYELFIEGKNIWNVGYLFEEDLLDSRRIINNIICSVYNNAKYYYKDHLKDKPDSFNCNSALTETIAFTRDSMILNDIIALK